MKIKGFILMSVSVALVLVSCSKSAVKSTKVETKLDSLSYAFGINIFTSLKQDSITLDPLITAKAMMDAEDGKMLMDDNIARGFIMMYINEREQIKREKEMALNKVRFKDMIVQGDSFLQKNKERQGVIVTPSGLQYEVIKMGTGSKPSETSTVRVLYVGTLINGTKFDSSVDKKAPAEFQVNAVIKGWTEALQLMPVGSKFKLYIPESLAYGGNGAGDLIKPYSTLVFEVELLEIVKQ